MAGGEASEKEHEPTQKRLEDARARGEVVRSSDLATAAAYGGLLLAAAATGPQGLQAVGQAGSLLLGYSDRISVQMRENGAAVISEIFSTLLWGLAPFFLLPATLVIATLLAQRALVFTPDKLAPKLARISPSAALKQKFGREGLFEFAKSVVKLGVVSTVLAALLAARMPRILGTLYQTPALATVQLLRLGMEFLMLVLAVTVAIGALDYLWQRAQFLRRNRMSRQEMMDEFKLSEGDPHLRAQRRLRGQEIAMNRMLIDVPTADVVIVNPSHYAVALKWARNTGRAPICVAKGVDEVAARIRARAVEAGVPIHRDPPTARALHATLSLGEEVPPAQYRAVAAAIRFAETMRKRARRKP